MAFYRQFSDLPIIDQLRCTYSDQFKSAYGFRPRHNTDDWSVEKFRAEIDHCDTIVQEQMDAKVHNARRFEDRIAQLIAIGAGHRDTALEWLLQGNKTMI